MAKALTPHLSQPFHKVETILSSSRAEGCARTKLNSCLTCNFLHQKVSFVNYKTVLQKDPETLADNEIPKLHQLWQIFHLRNGTTNLIFRGNCLQGTFER